jgi:hypothetical protein
VSFLEQMAAGLTDLAAALDEAKRSAEPARFNTAARITHNLQQAVMQWTAVREADWGLSGQRVLWICACETT